MSFHPSRSSWAGLKVGIYMPQNLISFSSIPYSFRDKVCASCGVLGDGSDMQPCCS